LARLGQAKCTPSKKNLLLAELKEERTNCFRENTLAFARELSAKPLHGMIKF
jgi:hypothetical protein